MRGFCLSTRLFSNLRSKTCLRHSSFIRGPNVASRQSLTSYSTAPNVGEVREGGVMKSPYPDIDIPTNVNMAHHMMEHFNKFGDNPALVDGVTGRTITYGQLPLMVRRTASALVRMGLGRGDVVTIFSPNLPEFAIVYLATVAMGGTVSCLNPLYTPTELKHALDLSKAKAVVTIPVLAPTVKAAVKGNIDVKNLISIGEVEGFRPLSDMLFDDGSLCPETPTLDPMTEVAALPLSSGTTGLPKAVRLSHYNIVANVQQTSCSDDVISYDPDTDCVLGLLPFFHIFGQSAVMLGCLRNGVKIVTLPKFEPEQFLLTMQGHRVTTAHVAPPIILFLAKHPYVEMFNLQHMHTMISGAAPAPEAVVREMMDRLKIKDFAFRQAYGMTESSPATHCNPKRNFKITSCGHAVHNTEFKIVDTESGKALGQDEEGELWVRGPQVMLGYLNNPQATAETLDEEGWLHTGDLAHYDSDQHVHITDRLKELIKHKGFQVAPAELEELLLSHPAVSDAAVTGIPDVRAGELPRAFLILKPGSQLTEEEVTAFVKGKVASFKELSGGVEFRTEIPRNLSGKILRRLLRDEYIASQEGKS